jgi:hypothetical protein
MAVHLSAAWHLMAELSRGSCVLMTPFVGKILNQFWETWVGLPAAFSPVTAAICSMLFK